MDTPPPLEPFYFPAQNFFMEWIEAFALMPFERPLIWLMLWPAPSLYAWAEGYRSKRLYLVNLLIGWLPPFWLITWWLAIFPPMLERPLPVWSPRFHSPWKARIPIPLLDHAQRDVQPSNPQQWNGLG